MSNSCLSPAAILRCPSLTQFQYIVILIPTVLEAIFTSSLAVMMWKAGQRRHLLLTSEGWIRLVLGVVDLLSHILTAARTDVTVFTAFDTGLGVASFLPLFFYTFFLYVYTNSDLLANLPSLPKLLARIASLLLLFCVPAIVIANEVGSLVGVKRIASQGQILIGFESRSLFTINAFFSSLTLALLIAFQAIVFLVAFFRLMVALFNQRKFRNEGKDAAHLVRGIAWLSLGVKLGAIETLIGFAGGGFGVVLTRHILRFISRACLCIGIVKGPDKIEDFKVIRKEMIQSRSKFTLSPFDVQSSPPVPTREIRAMISNPRLSTFQQLSPTAKGFYSLPRAHLYKESTFDFNKQGGTGSIEEGSQEGIYVTQVVTSDGKQAIPRLRSLQELKGIEAFTNLKEQALAQRQLSAKPSNADLADDKADRVTIGVRNSNGAPTLLLKRFSSAVFPSPTNIIESVRTTFFRGSKLGAFSERRTSGIPTTYDEKEYGDSYTIPTLPRRQSTASSYASSMMEKEVDEDPITLLRPNVSRLPSKSPFPIQPIRPGSGHYIRSSVLRASQSPSLSDSAISGLEIVSGPRRTLSQKRAKLEFYNVTNSQFDSVESPTQFETQDKDTILQPPQAMLTQKPSESSESIGPSSTNVEYPQSRMEPSSELRIVSDYSQYRDSNGTDYRASQIMQPRDVRNITRQFPGPPLTFNGMPVMGGLEQRRIYDDDDSSAPVTPVPTAPTNRRASGLRNEVDVRRQSVMENRLSVRSEQSEQSRMSISSSFEGVVPTIQPPPPVKTRASITDDPRYKLSRRDTVSSEASRYSFDVDLESGRSSFASDVVDAYAMTPKVVVTSDLEEGQRSPAGATDGHGHSTPKVNANSLGLKLQPSTTTLGGRLRAQPSMASMASVISTSTEVSVNPFKDNHDSPASTTFAVDLHPHNGINRIPASATQSPSSSRPLTPLVTRDLDTLTVPSHNVSAPTSPGDDDIVGMNRFSASPFSVIDNLPTAAIIDSVNDIQSGRGRSINFGGWPAFASPQNGDVDLPPAFRGQGTLAERRRRPPSQITWILNGASAAPARPLPKVPAPQPAQARRPPTPPMASSRSRSNSRTRSKSRSNSKAQKDGQELDSDVEEDSKRRRQRSMDMAAHTLSSSIPWLKNPDEEEDRELKKVIASSGRVTSPISPLVISPTRPPSKTYPSSSKATRPSSGKNSRRVSMKGSPSMKAIKSIGSVKQRTTPRPIKTLPHVARGSVHIQPIMIPRQSMYGSMVQPVNPSSPATTARVGRGMERTGRSNVRKDSGVFGAALEESDMKRQDYN